MQPDAISIKPQVPPHSVSLHKVSSVDCEDSQYMASVEHVLQQINSVLAIESVVTHYDLGYTGTFDCVVNYRLVLCLTTKLYIILHMYRDQLCPVLCENCDQSKSPTGVRCVWLTGRVHQDHDQHSRTAMIFHSKL